MKDENERPASLFHAIWQWSKADAVSFSRVDMARRTVFHQALTYHSDAVELLTSPWVANTCCDRNFSTAEPFSISSNSKAAGDVACPMMLAEGFEAYLGVPVFFDGVCVGALEVMCVAARDWSQEDIQKLTEYSCLVEAQRAGLTNAEVAVSTLH